MKKLIFPFLVAFVLISCNGSSQSKLMSVEEFDKKLSATSGAQLVDVRTPEEYAERHLANAANLNFNADDFIEKIEKLDKAKPVFVYCLSGGRSHKAAALMTKKGFKEVYEMDGGILAWSDSKKPLTEATVKQEGMNIEDYLKQITSDKLVLVDFNAVWCGPCKLLKPILAKVEKKNTSKLEVVAIDVDQNPALANDMHIRNIPLLIMYKKGKEVWRSTGLVEEGTIQEQVDKNL
ncbi:MAG: thioredoxin domain-containing protein [Chitinophagales bacterium]